MAKFIPLYFVSLCFIVHCFFMFYGILPEINHDDDDAKYNKTTQIYACN